MHSSHLRTHQYCAMHHSSRHRDEDGRRVYVTGATRAMVCAQPLGHGEYDWWRLPLHLKQPKFLLGFFGAGPVVM